MAFRRRMSVLVRFRLVQQLVLFIKTSTILTTTICSSSSRTQVASIQRRLRQHSRLHHKVHTHLHRTCLATTITTTTSTIILRRAAVLIRSIISISPPSIRECSSSSSSSTKTLPEAILGITTTTTTTSKDITRRLSSEARPLPHRLEQVVEYIQLHTHLRCNLHQGVWEPWRMQLARRRQLQLINNLARIQLARA